MCTLKKKLKYSKHICDTWLRWKSWCLDKINLTVHYIFIVLHSVTLGHLNISSWCPLFLCNGLMAVTPPKKTSVTTCSTWRTSSERSRHNHGSSDYDSINWTHSSSDVWLACCPGSLSRTPHCGSAVGTSPESRHVSGGGGMVSGRYDTCLSPHDSLLSETRACFTCVYLTETFQCLGL